MVGAVRFELTQPQPDVSDSQQPKMGIQTMHTHGHEHADEHRSKTEPELLEFISYLTTIESRERDRAIRLLANNVDGRVWSVAMLYVSTCAGK